MVLGTWALEQAVELASWLRRMLGESMLLDKVVACHYAAQGCVGRVFMRTIDGKLVRLHVLPDRKFSCAGLLLLRHQLVHAVQL